jgi:hypothetical protein
MFLGRCHLADSFNYPESFNLFKEIFCKAATNLRNIQTNCQQLSEPSSVEKKFSEMILLC